MKRARDPTDHQPRNIRRIPHPLPNELDPRFFSRDITCLLLTKYVDVKDIPAISQTSVFLRTMCHETGVLVRTVTRFTEYCNFLYSCNKSLEFMAKLIPFVETYLGRNGPLIPELIRKFAGFLAAAYDSRPLNCLAFRLLPSLDIPSKGFFQTNLIRRYQTFSDDIDYCYAHNDLFGACCKLPLRTKADLDTLYGPLLLGTDVDGQVFVLLWAFNLLDLENESMSVVIPLIELDPFKPFITSALEKIVDLLSLTFELLGENESFRQPFVDFFRKHFRLEIHRVNLDKRLEADPELIFSIIEVIWAMYYKDQARVCDRLRKVLQLSNAYAKWAAVMEAVDKGDTAFLPFECDAQKHLYKIIWLSKHRSTQSTNLEDKMVTPLKLCMESSLDPDSRDWLISTILMLSPDVHLYKMLIRLRLGQAERPDGPMWLELFPSTNALWTFFSLLEQNHEVDLDSMFDVWMSFERIVEEFRQAVQHNDHVGMRVFDNAIEVEPFVRALKVWTISPDQAFLRQARPNLLL